MSKAPLPAKWFIRYRALEAQGYSLAKRIEILNDEFPELPPMDAVPQAVTVETVLPPPRKDVDD